MVIKNKESNKPLVYVGITYSTQPYDGGHLFIIGSVRPNGSRVEDRKFYLANFQAALELCNVWNKTTDWKYFVVAS